MTRFAHSSRKKQRGTAVMETVVVTPVILFLLLVGAEITNAFIDHNTLTKATRNAIRHLASNAAVGTTGVVALTPDIVTETRNLVVFGNVAGAGTAILPGLAVGNVQVQDIGGNNIQVSASYAYSGILGNSLPAFGLGSDVNLGMTLRASSSMRAL